MKNKLHCNGQHGFVPGRSCITQLLVVIELLEMLDFDDSVDAIYLDFSKAFDIVPRERLVNKPKAYGIVKDTYDRIRAFSTRRTHHIVVNCSLSSWADVLSGIPNGSVIGAILFALFINDLPAVVRSTVDIFADDTKLYRKALIDKVCIELQPDLTWSKSGR